VTVDTPRGVYYGSQVAAPTFKRIMDRMFSLRDCSVSCELREALESKEHDTPVLAGVKERVVVPDVCGLSLQQAEETLRTKGLIGVYKARNGVVCGQWPVEGTKVGVGTRVWLTSAPEQQVGNRPFDRAQGRLPNVRGMSFREALRRLTSLGVHVSIRGKGTVKRQYPRAGTRVREGMVCVLEGA